MPDGQDIANFLFIDSPDVRKDQPKNFGSECEAKLALDQDGFPDGTIIKPLRRNEYQIWDEGKLYVRIFQIKVPIEGIKLLVKELSADLARPIKEKWAGVTFTDVIGENHTNALVSTDLTSG